MDHNNAYATAIHQTDMDHTNWQANTKNKPHIDQYMASQKQQLNSGGQQQCLGKNKHNQTHMDHNHAHASTPHQTNMDHNNAQATARNQTQMDQHMARHIQKQKPDGATAMHKQKQQIKPT